MSSKYRIRRDANHSRITADLEAHGFVVTDLAATGAGVCDIFTHKKNGSGATVFVEIKFGEKAELKKSQVNFLSTFPGFCGIARDFGEALRLAKYPDEFCLTRKQKERLAAYHATMKTPKVHLKTILEVIEL